MFINSDILLEEKLTKEQKDKLKPSDFGIPSERKFPLNDRKRVKAAITYFATYKGSDKNKKELAENIKKACKKFDVRYNHADNFVKFLNEEVISLTEVFKTMADKNILNRIKTKYKGVDASNRNLISESTELIGRELLLEEDLISILENYDQISNVCKSEESINNILNLCETVGLLIHEDHEILKETNYKYKLNEAYADYLLSEAGGSFSKKDTEHAKNRLKNTKSEKGYKNVYIILYSGGGALASIIKPISKGHFQYNHASISLDKSMENIYGMGLRGMEHEKFESYLNNNKSYADIFRVRLNSTDYNKAIKLQNELLKDDSKTEYNLLQLFNFLFAKIEHDGTIKTKTNTEIDENGKIVQVCSSFVMYFLMRSSNFIKKLFKGIDEDWVNITPNRIPYLSFVDYLFTHIHEEDYKKELKEYEDEEGKLPN